MVVFMPNEPAIRALSSGTAREQDVRTSSPNPLCLAKTQSECTATPNEHVLVKAKIRRFT
jgi:hypothetical protein